MERVEKLPSATQWTLTLRQMVQVPGGKLRVNWWTEEFDAVVVAQDGKSDAPWVPPIPGLDEWAHAFPDQIYHGREYRRPEHVAGKVSERSKQERTHLLMMTTCLRMFLLLGVHFLAMELRRTFLGPPILSLRAYGFVSMSTFIFLIMIELMI